MPGSGPSIAGPSLAGLTDDPHPLLAELRARGPVLWVDALGGWLVTGHAIAASVMRDAQAFTVDDPRFSTSRVVGASMLSTDGVEHGRHRQPFLAPFTPRATRGYFADFVKAEAARLVSTFAPSGAAELRTALAAPLATAGMQLALGLQDIPVAELLGWYGGIVAAVAEITAGADPPAYGRAAYLSLSAAVEATIASGGHDTFLGQVLAEADALSTAELISNAAVLMFGGIETTEGMIANLLLHLLASDTALADLLADPGLVDAAIEESLRLEPAAAVVDRYATRDLEVAGASVRRGDLVVVSLAGANRDPEVFDEPDVFDLHRVDARRHLAFAQGPHTCIGLHLARWEARCAVQEVLTLDDLALDRARSTAPTGLVFRKPAAVQATWSARARPVPVVVGERRHATADSEPGMDVGRLFEEP